MMRPTVQIIGTEKIVCYSSQGEGYTMPCRATWRGIRADQEAEGAGGNHRQEPFLWFCGKEQVRQGQWSTGGLVGIISADPETERLSPVVWYLVLGGLGQSNSDLGCKSSIEEVWEYMGSGLVDLHIKVVIVGDSLAIFTNELATGRAGSPPLVHKIPDAIASRIQKIRKI